MSVVVMVNEKFREGVPPWEVINFNYLIIKSAINCTNLDYELEISIYM